MSKIESSIASILVNPSQLPALTGDVTTPAGSNVTSIGATTNSTLNTLGSTLGLKILNGSVGIGTTLSPTRKLDIVSNGAASPNGLFSQVGIHGTVDPTSKLNIGYDTTGNFGFFEAVHESVGWLNLALQPTGGNVGVGTTNAVEKLQIAGAVKFTGNIQADTANSGAIDYFTGNTRFYSWGPDDSTAGGFQFTNKSSAGSIGTLALSIDGNQKSTFTGQLIGKGTATNDNAAAGVIGEYLSATSAGAFANVTTTNTWQDMGNISLTAGDWDVSLIATISLNGAVMTAFDIGISQTSGNSATGLLEGDSWYESAALPAGSVHQAACVPSWRRSLASTTSIYAKVKATFASGNPQFSYRISARRVR